MNEQGTSQAQGKVPRLLPPTALLVLGSVLVSLLVLLLPDRDELQDLIATHEPDQLSLTYLELALSESPHDPKLRLLLARQYHGMSRYRAAARVLSPLVRSDAAAGRAARLLLVEIEHARCTGVLAREKARCPQAVIEAMAEVLTRDQPLAAAVLERFAEISMANRKPALAGTVYSQLADTAGSSAQRTARRQDAAFAYLQAGQPERAAAMHAQVAREQPAPEAATHVERAVTHLRQAERSSDALALVLEELERAPDSRRLLESAIGLALENQRPELAARLGRRRLALQPDDAELVAEQLAAELAIGDLERARVLAQRLIELRPEDERAHEHLARIADWTARPLVALEQWGWLALHTERERHRQRALDLARAQWDQDLLLELKQRAVRAHPDDLQGRLELARLYLRLGQPDDARAIIEQLVARRPGHRPCWDALLEVHGATTDHAAEAATWAHIHQQFGATEAETRAWAQALWQARRPEQALAVLEERTAAPANDEAAQDRGPMADETLRMIAELAWQLEELDRARDAYLALWQRGRAELQDAQRLIVVARATGEVELALDVATGMWQREHEPSMLLAAMQIAADAERWDEVAALEAEAGPGVLDSSAAYWRLRTARRRHLLRVALAQGDLTRASAILDDMSRELATAAAASRELVQHPGYRELWAGIHRQQIHVALQRGDYAALERVLDAAPELRGTLDYWRLRLMLGHRRLNRAVRDQDFERAQAILDRMQGELAQAEAQGLASDPEYATIRDDMNRQRFYVALARDDMATAARLLDVVDIPEIDRVRVLRRLGREQNAASLALAAKREHSVRDADSAELDAHVEALTGRMARHVGGHARAVELGGLGIQEVGQEIAYSWQDFGVGAQLVGRRMSDDEAFVAHEAELRLHGRWLAASRETELGMGANLRPSSTNASADAVPQLDIMHEQRLGAGVAVRVDGAMGRVAEERASLRPWAVRDHAALQMTWQRGDLFAFSRLGAYWYRYRNDERLGTGKDAYGSLGYKLMSGPRDWNLRVVGGAATRACALEQCCDGYGAGCGLAPSEKSGVVALATTYSSGWPGHTVTAVERLRYSLELMGGWLMPADRLVYSASFAIGVPILGADRLSISAELATEFDPGQGGVWAQARRGVMLEYAHSLWH